MSYQNFPVVAVMMRNTILRKLFFLSLPEILERFYASKNTNVVTAFVCHCHEGVVQKAALQLRAHNEISVSFNMKQKG